MASRQVGVLHGLTKLVAAEAAGLTDGQLLRRFADARDDAAFAALIQRHGPLVYGVCRNVLRNEHNAEDAFQATFLVLARRAGVIREGLALGGWLYRVAYRVATKARLSADRRRRREASTSRPEDDRPVGDLAWRDLQAMLDEELNRLPEKYRAPFVLCVLAGKSKPEAAAELGWKEGTVSSRLAHAREKLRVRLARRGVALSAILSGLAIAENGAVTAVPPALVETTRQAAVAYALGQAVADAPAALARAVLRGMSLARLRYLGIAVAVLGVAATVAVASRPRPPHAEAPPPAPDVAAAPAPAPAKEPAPPAPRAPAGMTLTGDVTGPGGRPVPNARVTVVVGQNPPARDVVNAASFRLSSTGEVRADDGGAFRVTVPQTTPARHRRLTAVAKAPGYGFASRAVGPKFLAESRLNLPHLILTPGRPARARLVGSDGHPARGATVHVLGMERGTVTDPGDAQSGVLVLYYEPPVPLPDWPGPLVTDDDGTFTVPEVVPGTMISCQVRDDRYAPQWVRFKARADDTSGPPTIKLAPPRELTGRVLTADSGRPVADAIVVVETQPPTGGTFPGYIQARTDADGRYTVKPFPGPETRVTVYPPAGVPYPVLTQIIPWPADKDRTAFDVSLPRGVLVRGVIEEAESGRRVAGAAVDYKWADRFKSPSDRPPGDQLVRGTVTGPDGTFTLAVPPGAGHVVVKAAEPDYVPVEFPGALLRGYGKGGRPVFPDGLASLRPAVGADPQDVTVRLRRGVTVRGRVVGADGRPVRVATLYAAHYRPRGIDPAAQGVPVRDGRFELPGCEPGARVPVLVYDATGRQGAFAELPADPAAEPEVRLAPTVSTQAKFVDRVGQPVPKARLILAAVLRPGDDEQESVESGGKSMISVPARDVHEVADDPPADETGTLVLKGLIPGAAYTFKAGGPAGVSGRQTFTAPAGTGDLGRVVVRRGTQAPFRVGQRYFYHPIALDPDGDPVTLSLVEGPPGMTMDPETGAILWVPGPGQAGVHKVRIRASDPFGGTAVQAYQLRIAP